MENNSTEYCNYKKSDKNSLDKTRKHTFKHFTLLLMLCVLCGLVSHHIFTTKLCNTVSYLHAAGRVAKLHYFSSLKIFCKTFVYNKQHSKNI